MSPVFASGMVFVSSVMDRLTCQAFYNPFLVQIIDAIARGRDRREGPPQGTLMQIQFISTIGPSAYPTLIDKSIVVPRPSR
eukprot:151669-Prorocentrum_minimum.AAC.1